jgi:hypothetical protein
MCVAFVLDEGTRQVSVAGALPSLPSPLSEVGDHFGDHSSPFIAVAVALISLHVAAPYRPEEACGNLGVETRVCEAYEAIRKYDPRDPDKSCHLKTV